MTIILKIQSLSKTNKHKFHIFLKKKHKIIDFLGYFEINPFTKLTKFKLNFNKIKFYLKKFKINPFELNNVNLLLKL